MAGTIPPNYGGLPQDPPAIVETVRNIQEGINGAREANAISDEIARQIGHVAVQGTSQRR